MVDVVVQEAAQVVDDKQAQVDQLRAVTERTGGDHATLNTSLAAAKEAARALKVGWGSGWVQWCTVGE